MELTIYKGFNTDFLQGLSETPLVETEISQKINVLSFDNKYRKALAKALLLLDEDDSVWITYEEYSLIHKRVEDAIIEDNLSVKIFRNNLYPDHYPIAFEITPELANEFISVCNGDTQEESTECAKFSSIYSTLSTINGNYYGSFYDYEHDHSDDIKVEDFYPAIIRIEDCLEDSDYDIFINDDIDTYLRDLENIQSLNPKTIGVKTTSSLISNRILKSLQAYCKINNIRIVKFHDKLSENIELEKDLISIAQNDIHIDNFTSFRKLKFYKNPDINKEIIELSQAHIIEEIIKQAEFSYDSSSQNSRDIFITAPTGAGKSIMFQIPAIYLAKKYHKLTIIIEPVKALMQDQKEKLNKNGYMRVAAFNSDLTQIEKEAVLEKIKNGEVDLLYLSPETLLSYSIETIIGDREIGLLIVDEAHIVTTWGVGFRPDYWYLGSYINQLRNQIQTSKGMKRRTYHFPICTFTATAINGGIDDSVSDTIISLYMENPIKYIGYVRRDDIKFDITIHGDNHKLPQPNYEEAKTKVLNERINTWLTNSEKTIVYFPYASLARDASKGFRSFAGITRDKRIDTYTGRNIEEMNTEAFNEYKKMVFEGFRNGTKPIMFATKAFGMGVDVNDVKNVYHYAVSGNLCDYVQEIGRAARRKDLIGSAITDFFYNDMNFMNVLFGMSQIKQYQVKKVLDGIYNTYKSKNEARSFLISPQSFTYIFNDKDEKDCINKLKTTLLMIEKDFQNKFPFKVLISRPQSIFTKAFICVSKEHKNEVLSSKYGKYMTYIEEGRIEKLDASNSKITDPGDIYLIDLKSIWEKFHGNISFPQFKYWFFNSNSKSKDKVAIMPSIREYIYPRQKISVETRGDYILSDLRELIFSDFEYISDILYANFRNKFFTTDDFVNAICKRYGRPKARIIANSIFQLVDPKEFCIKTRSNDSSGKNYYSITNGNFKEMMRHPIIRSNIVCDFSRTDGDSSYFIFMNLKPDDPSSAALKLLSIFDYITYEITGGEEPEIFIRLNDPSKVRSIVYGSLPYSNGYVTKAKDKHARDLAILLKFFKDLETDDQRWEYIEDYFLGYDVLCGAETKIIKTVKLSRSVDKEHSYPTNMFKSWKDLIPFFDPSEKKFLDSLLENNIPLPSYLMTTIKKSDEGRDILMSWPAKDTLICHQDTSEKTLEYFGNKGWHAYRFYEIDYKKLKDDLS